MADADRDNGRPTAGASPDPAEIERRHVDELARAHAALAAAQDRSYWLDRWGVDLNALMRRPAAGRVRAALRAVREVKRGGIAVKRYADARLGELREAKAEDEIAAGAARDRGANGGGPSPNDS